MVHVRLNERESNPNHAINFISVLDPSDEDARQLMRAIAAQLKPVMKTHGFSVNSFEEYEHNKVFAGRNWNNGEVVELVLRSSSGSFLPMSWLMNTFCHELAHNKHMNHGADFQALWNQLRNEVRALQNKGYYGDGYWSAGTRLADSARVTGQGVDFGECPEYMCGGAQKRTRPTSLRRRSRGDRAPAIIGPSLHTGRQTAKKRKAGTRLTGSNIFVGDGKALNADVVDEDQKKKGTGFGKQAASKRAREERALAAERRIKALQSQSIATSSKSSIPEDAAISDDNEDAEDYIEEITETDQDRRKAMLDAATQDTELDNFKYSFPDDFDFKFPSPSQDEDDLQITTREGPSGSRDKALLQNEEDSSRPLKRLKPSGESSSKKILSNFGFGSMVNDEIQLRKKESIGLALTGSQRLGGGGSGSGRTVRAEKTNRAENGNKAETWSCLVCTLNNIPEHLACSACRTPRGESTLVTS